MLTSSVFRATKVHAPRGIGCAVREKQRTHLPHSFGGGQEKKSAPGTEGVPQIAFRRSGWLMMTEKRRYIVKAVQAHLIERLKAMPEVVLNCPETRCRIL